jgi:hypothetical protein
MFFWGDGRKGAFYWSIGFLKIFVILVPTQQLFDLMIQGVFKMLETK